MPTNTAKKTVLITGGTGLVGSQLTSILLEKGYNVSYLSRTTCSIKNVTTYKWDIAKQSLDKEAIETADYVIHLAGAGVADSRWTDARKKAILESRTHSSHLLVKSIHTIPNNIQALISASAIGLYGLDTDTECSENTIAGNDFLANVVKAWEQEIDQLTDTIRCVKLRIGVVFSKRGGALEKIAEPIRWGVGASLGTGSQTISWIHISDLCQMFLYALEQKKLLGAYNAVAPNPLSNSKITKIIAKALHKPLILPPVPAFALKLMLGEMSEMVLGNLYVSSDKILQTGFQFEFQDAEKAINHLLSHTK